MSKLAADRPPQLYFQPAAYFNMSASNKGNPPGFDDFFSTSTSSWSASQPVGVTVTNHGRAPRQQQFSTFFSTVPIETNNGLPCVGSLSFATPSTLNASWHPASPIHCQPPAPQHSAAEISTLTPMPTAIIPNAQFAQIENIHQLLDMSAIFTPRSVSDVSHGRSASALSHLSPVTFSESSAKSVEYQQNSPTGSSPAGNFTADDFDETQTTHRSITAEATSCGPPSATEPTPISVQVCQDRTAVPVKAVSEKQFSSKSTTKSSSHRPATGPEKRVPRPDNPFFVYKRDKKESMMRIHPGVSHATLSRLIAISWREESEDVKDFYRRKANDVRKEHQLKFPGYRYVPRRKKPDEPRQIEEDPTTTCSTDADAATQPASQQQQGQRRGRPRRTPRPPPKPKSNAPILPRVPTEGKHQEQQQLSIPVTHDHVSLPPTPAQPPQQPPLSPSNVPAFRPPPDLQDPTTIPPLTPSSECSPSTGEVTPTFQTPPTDGSFVIDAIPASSAVPGVTTSLVPAVFTTTATESLHFGHCRAALDFSVTMEEGSRISTLIPSTVFTTDSSFAGAMLHFAFGNNTSINNELYNDPSMVDWKGEATTADQMGYCQHQHQHQHQHQPQGAPYADVFPPAIP